MMLFPSGCIHLSIIFFLLQTEQSDLTLRTVQLRVPCVPLQMQVDELCIKPLAAGSIKRQ